MSGVEVSTDIDVSLSNPGDPVVVLADSDIETILVNEQGPPGRPGPPGPQGPMGTEGLPGNTVLYGAGDPTTPLGRDGDFYINTTTNFIFGPKAGIWPAGISLIGPQGIPGNTVLYGAGAPAAGTGVDGNFYIDTTAHFLYGPKAAGAWPAGTSMIGPQGPQGIQGIQGPPGAVPEAPTDGKIYGRQNSAWAEAGSFPTGTVMVFYQAAAPTGWTKLTTQNDKALRVVSGAGGVAGGTNPFSTVMAQTAVGNHTLTLGETPAGITASWGASLTVYPGASSGFNMAVINGTTWYQLGVLSSATTGVPPGYNIAYTNTTDAPTGLNYSAGTNSATATSLNTGGGAHNHPITMAIQYCDVILASKN
jgi:hypothetical protein